MAEWLDENKLLYRRDELWKDGEGWTVGKTVVFHDNSAPFLILEENESGFVLLAPIGRPVMSVAHG